MELQELFKACVKQKGFPNVKCEFTVKYASSNIGVVTVIKPHGIAVRFEGMTYDSWFYNANGVDKRSKYMYQLKIIE